MQSLLALFALLSASFSLSTETQVDGGVLRQRLSRDSQTQQNLAPKFMIINLFSLEAEAWYGNGDEFNLLAHNITLPGLSPRFPAVHCSENYDICQVITGEAEVNAASTISALVLSSKFDLTKTYFMIAGIAGINPNEGSIADVTFARYAVQVALQYEIDAREKPQNFSTGYFPQGSTNPNEYPQSIYGTEVFEVNDALRKVAVKFAQKATLNDSAAAQAYRSMYLNAAARQPPSVRECDTATSDVFYSGPLLGDAFGNYIKLATNGSGIYCTTAQEDVAVLEALVRGAAAKLLDFSRVIVMRTASNFERPHPGESILQNLIYEDSGALDPSLRNVYLAGVQVVNGVVSGWKSTFEAGIKANNYVGDIFGTLGGTPDFGPPISNDNPVGKRSLRHRSLK